MKTMVLRNLSVVWAWCVVFLMMPTLLLAQYQMNGAATQTSCNCYQLTPDAGNQNGSVWNINQISLANPFDFNFDVFLGCNDGGADGLAFVLQPLSVNAGSAGGGLGYAGIVPSLAIEIDTYQNASDPAFDHISLQLNGDVNHGGGNNLAGPVQASATTGNIEDCQWHTLQVVWNPATQTLQVYFDGALRLTWVGNLALTLPNVYWGFTAATGGAQNQHQFCNALNPNFNIGAIGNCQGLPIQFTSTSTTATSTITNYQWTFGDGGTGTGATPTHTYAAAGVYNVSLTITSEGCTQSFSNNITVNPSPTVNAGVDVSVCSGSGISLNNPNVNVPGTYTWSPAAGLNATSTASPLASPLATTTYTLTLTDNNGCTGSDDVVVTVNPLPNANAGTDQDICNGNSTTLQATGGVTFSWAPATGLSATNVFEVNANPSTTTTYTVTVTDANNCQATDDVIVTVNPLPTANAGADQTICAGTSAQLNALGGVQYSWSPTTALDDANIGNPQASPMATTVYTVTATDAIGCSNTDDVTITVNPIPVLNLGPDVNVCQGSGVQLNNPNSLGSGTYAWAPVAGLSNASAPSPTASPAATTNYTLTYTTNQNCSVSDNITVNVVAPPVINAGLDVAFCDGGSVNLSASGAVNYAWAPPVGLDNALIGSPVASPAATTTYTVTGTDANGCTGTDDVEVTVNPLPTVSAGPDLTVCESGQAILAGVGVGTYSWAPTTGLSNASVQAPVVTAAVDVTYTLTVTDLNGCQQSDDMVLTVAPLPTAVIDAISDVCEGSATQFSHSSTGNLTTQFWQFGDGANSAIATPGHTYAGPGTYNVSLTVNTVDGCTATENASAVVVAVPQAVIQVVNGPDFCEGQPIQFINATAGPLTGVLWNFRENALIPGLPNTTSTLDNPTFAYQYFGTYSPTLLVTAGNGCSDQATVTLNIHDNPVAAFDFSVVCEGQASQFNDLSTVLGGYNFTGWTWNFGDGAPPSNLQNPTHQFATDGSYQVSLTSQTNMGCTNTLTQNVWVNNTPTVNLSANEVCEGGVTQFTNSTDPQDATVVTWLWDLGDGNTLNTLDGNQIYATSGTFNITLTATTDSGCVATNASQAIVHPYPTPQFSVSDDEGCSPHPVLFQDLSTISYGTLAQWDWNFGDGGTGSNNLVSYTYADSGYYDVTLTVTSAFGCTSTASFADLIRVIKTPIARFDRNPAEGAVITMLDPRIQFTNTSLYAQNYTWAFGDGATSTAINPSHTYPDSGNYVVVMRAINEECWDEATTDVRIDPETFIYVPNTFTPNGNGLNDGFKASVLGVQWFRLGIFDRWGQEIFYSIDPQQGWDGTSNGKEVPIGTYPYRIDYKDANGREHVRLGRVHLIR